MLLTVTISEQAVVKTERAVARKVRRALPAYREALRSTGVRIVRDPAPEDMEAQCDIIDRKLNVPIVVAAM